MKTMRRFLLLPSISSQPRLNWIELNWIELTRSFDIPNSHIISYHIISSRSFYLDAVSYISPPLQRSMRDHKQWVLPFTPPTLLCDLEEIGSMCKKYENAKIWNQRACVNVSCSLQFWLSLWSEPFEWIWVSSLPQKSMSWLDRSSCWLQLRV